MDRILQRLPLDRSCLVLLYLFIPPPPVCGALTGIPVELHTWPSMSDLLLCFQGVVGPCEAPPGRGAAARLPNHCATRNSSAAPWGGLFQDVKSRRKPCCHKRRKAGARGVRAIRPGRLSLQKVRACTRRSLAVGTICAAALSSM